MKIRSMRGNLGYSGNRSAVGWDAKLGTQWRLSKTDAVQFNFNYSGRRLTAQGFRLPNFVANAWLSPPIQTKEPRIRLHGIRLVRLTEGANRDRHTDPPKMPSSADAPRASCTLASPMVSEAPQRPKKDESLQYDNQL